MKLRADTKAMQETLNRTYNRLADVLDEEGVQMLVTVAGYPILSKQGHSLPWTEGLRNRSNRETEPPKSYDEFLNRQCQTDKEKGHDYDYAYMNALFDYGATIWKWEVTKKLNRIRTWLKKGELKVKGEGVVNAVGDLFNYTVMYQNFLKATAANEDPCLYDNPETFLATARIRSPKNWVTILILSDLIVATEKEVIDCLLTYMGQPNTDL